MNVFVEVEVRAQDGTDKLVAALRDFAASEPSFSYDKSRSTEYSQQLDDSIGSVLQFGAGENRPVAISLYEEKPGLMRVGNIVPSSPGQLDTDQYNGYAREFTESLRRWSRKNKKGLRIRVSKSDLELEDIIPTAIPLKLFNIYLGNYPLSYHPLDVERLDRFICGVARYSRKPINWEHLSEYLIENKGWPSDGVEWCIQRIKTGLEIINVYKKF